MLAKMICNCKNGKLITQLLEELIHTLQVLIILQHVTDLQVCYIYCKVIKVIVLKGCRNMSVPP